MKTSLRYNHLTTVEIEHEFYKGFYVDIVFDNEEQTFDMWLFHEHYGIKDLMVGLPKENTCFGKHITETLETVLEDVQYQAEESIPIYIEQRESEDGRDWHCFPDSVDKSMLKLAADIHDFYDEYDPYCGAYSTRTEGVLDTYRMLRDDPESLVDNLSDIAEILEDEGDCFDWLTRAKELIDRINPLAEERTYRDGIEAMRAEWIGKEVSYKGNKYTVMDVDYNGALMINKPSDSNCPYHLETTAIGTWMIDKEER